MSLIDNTYFIGEINIPGTTTTAVANSLALFIEKYEGRYLRDALGYSLMKLFIKGLEEVVVAQRWNDLRDGCEYTDANGVTQYWSGFINDDWESPIANYVYYWWTRDNNTFTTQAGEVASKPDSSNVVSPALKQSRAYNEMVDQTKLLWDFLTNHKDEAGNLVYPEFNICDVSHKTFCKINSMNI